MVVMINVTLQFSDRYATTAVFSSVKLCTSISEKKTACSEIMSSDNVMHSQCYLTKVHKNLKL